MKLPSIKNIELKGKKVLYRADLNLPIQDGRVIDSNRLDVLLPGLKYMSSKGAKIIVISHFDRPKGEFVRSMSLAPITDLMASKLEGVNVKFAIDCIGEKAQKAVNSLEDGEILLLENLRFHKGEEVNDENFAKELASLADIYVNDAFSCSHREHASITSVAKILPSYAGELLAKEVEHLTHILSGSNSPLTVITGGSKVSTKLELLNNLVKKADNIVIAGAMANTFLLAKGLEVGKSLVEESLINDAKKILESASNNNCNIILPEDAVIASSLTAETCQIACVNNIEKSQMILDLGPKTIENIANIVKDSKLVVWNGPLGAFEYRPFDVASITLARYIAKFTNDKKITSVAGGGDVVAALKVAGLKESFTYVSTAGGAFLEWLEGKELPGITVLNSK